MIISFSDKRTEELWRTERSKHFGNVSRVAMRRLLQIHAAEQLGDLAIPPGNHLERLSGKRKGQYSIRVNDQWRICFRWTDHGAEAVEICDYH